MVPQGLTLTEQRKKMIPPLVIALILLGAFIYIMTVTQAELRAKKYELSQIHQKIGVLKDLEGYRTQEAALLEAFPALSNKDDVIKEIVNGARVAGIQVDEIDPQEEVIAGTNFIKMGLNIKGFGTYLSAFRFLRKLENSQNFFIPSKLLLKGTDLGARRSRRGQSGDLLDKLQPIDVTINAFLIQ